MEAPANRRNRLECPRNIIFWIEQEMRMMQRSSGTDALIIKGIQQKVFDAECKISENQNGYEQHSNKTTTPSCCKKEELLRSKEREIKECNDQIFAIKDAEMNRDQSWRNTQTGEVTRECPRRYATNTGLKASMRLAISVER